MAYNSKPHDIYIVGAQSTGKTTIVRALEDHFNKGQNKYEPDGHLIPQPKIITEVARTVLEQHNFTADDIKSSPARALALQQLILQAQLHAERTISGQDEWFISDRSGVDPIVYARKYVSEEAADELTKSPEWLELQERMRKSMIIVCEAGTNWLTNDGVRLMPEDMEDWMDFHELFCSSLEDLNLAYEVLPAKVTSLTERVMFILNRLEVTKRKR